MVKNSPFSWQPKFHYFIRNLRYWSVTWARWFQFISYDRIEDILIISQHLCLCVINGLLPACFPTKILYVFLFSLENHISTYTLLTFSRISQRWSRSVIYNAQARNALLGELLIYFPYTGIRKQLLLIITIIYYFKAKDSHIVNALTITFKYKNVEIFTRHELCQFSRDMNFVNFHEPRTLPIFTRHEIC